MTEGIEDDDPRVAELIAEIRRARGEDLAKTHPEFEWVARRDPDYMSRYVEYSSWMWRPTSPRALNDRDRSLIWIALLANAGYFMTLQKQMKKALTAGATTQEILEVLEVAVIPSGAPALELGLHLLAELDEDVPTGDATAPAATAADDPT